MNDELERMQDWSVKL